MARAIDHPQRDVAPPGRHLANAGARLWLVEPDLSKAQRHWQEASLSTWLTRKGSAEQLADFVAERAYFGRFAFGAREAARAWFDTEPDRLTWAQAAYLAALVQNPSRHPDAAARRARWVLGQLLAAGAITADEHAAALAELPL